MAPDLLEKKIKLEEGLPELPNLGNKKPVLRFALTLTAHYPLAIQEVW